MAPPPTAVFSENLRVEDVGVHAVTDTTAVTIYDPLTCNGIVSRRAKASPFNGGVAAATSSNLFKTKQPGKPKAKNWDHRLSQESKSRKASTLKNAAKYLATPGMISLGGGLPSSDYFPFEHWESKVPAAGKFSQAETAEFGTLIHIGKHDVKEGKSAFDLAIGLNYGQGTGSAQLLRWITEHTEIVHNPAYQDWQCIMSVGSTSALDMMYRMFLNRGDYIIAEEFTFATAVETVHPMGCKVVGVKMDSEGMLPEALDELLTNWDEAARGASKPFLLYIVPTGQNPTGATMGFDRRREIYKVSQKHDLIILEDEPYYFLQMQPYTGPKAPPAPLPKSHEEFLATLVPSLLHMDTDGRVVRLDSFSKVIAPGSRVGWIVACEQIAERFQRHNEVSVQNPSGFSQLMLHKLLDEEWGHGGYLDWLVNLRKEYTQRRDVMLYACEAYLPPQVASWVPPASGMFHWIKIDVEKHPEFGKKTLKEIEEEVFQAAVQEKVLISPGSWFFADQQAEYSELFFRATFAAAESDAMTKAIKRFGIALNKTFRLE
ncbi:Aromatic/aminoadipate aminotransferase 1 [Rhizina undulata]